MDQKHVLENLVLHQLLHGYAEGHRLLENSIEIPDESLRLVLRLSDLSGTNVTTGFEEYITGYPLTSLKAYALAKTWYAAEMPRPGCVWTHTIVIPDLAMAEMPSLECLLPLFKRPGRNIPRESYGKPLRVEPLPLTDPMPPIDESMLGKVFAVHYREKDIPVIVAARDSKEFESSVFALWSQKWPSLRIQFTFCTGALSMRAYERRPFEIQCVPTSRAREVMLDSKELSASGEAVIVNSLAGECPKWSITAAEAARHGSGWIVQDFLWQVAGENSGRADFAGFIIVYQALEESVLLHDLISVVAKYFPESHSALVLKGALFGERRRLTSAKYEERDVLFALGVTPHHRSFDSASLNLSKRGQQLWLNEPEKATKLVTELFRASLNPLGEEILAALIAGMEPEMARRIASSQLQFLPALFHAKPILATSAQLWLAAGDRKREMFGALESRRDLEPSVIRGIIRAFLESNSEFLIRRALDVWGRDAVYALLDWSQAYAGAISEVSREALRGHLSSVIDWIRAQKDPSLPMLILIARVLGRCASEVAKQDAGIWLRAFQELRAHGTYSDRIYMGAFLLALAFNNAPPDPAKLISFAFEEVHEAAWHERLSDDAWVVIEPFVPQLSWLSNWDKCERLRRGLIIAFVRNGWPSQELSECLKNDWLFDLVLRSAGKIDEGKRLIQH